MLPTTRCRRAIDRGLEAPDWEVPVFAQPVMLGELIKT